MHRKIHAHLLVAEVVLILASILIFRSGWHLLDKWPVFNETGVLVATLFFAFAIAVPMWRYVLNQQDKHHH